MNEFDKMRRDEYSDTNGPLTSMLVAIFWNIMAVIIMVEIIRLLIWLI